jgi:ATP dependent DNA ligase domain
MSWRTSPMRSRRTPPAGFILPCQPFLVARPPAGPGWLHEVKHDGYRITGLKQGERVTLWSRYGADFTDRLLTIADAIRGLPAENALVDGEAVAFRPDGRSDFGALRTKAGGAQACLVAFGPSTPRTCVCARSRSGATSFRGSFAASTASCSARRSRPRARSCSPTPASWASKGLCRSAPAAFIGAGRVAVG